MGDSGVRETEIEKYRKREGENEREKDGDRDKVREKERERERTCLGIQASFVDTTTDLRHQIETEREITW